MTKHQSIGTMFIIFSLTFFHFHLLISLGEIQFFHSVVIIHKGPKYTHAQTGPTHMH